MFRHGNKIFLFLNYGAMQTKILTNFCLMFITSINYVIIRYYVTRLALIFYKISHNHDYQVFLCFVC
jgi:hypothetical protein